jgi:hypothetical protein
MIRGRPFEPGNKLGRGRPPGSRNKRRRSAWKLLNEYSEKLIQKALVMGLEGNVSVMRLLVPYALPRPAEQAMKTGPLPSGTIEELNQSSAKLLQRVTSGEISLEQARVESALLKQRREVLETRELEERVRALEHPRKPEETESDEE